MIEGNSLRREGGHELTLPLMEKSLQKKYGKEYSNRGGWRESREKGTDLGFSLWDTPTFQP